MVLQVTAQVKTCNYRTWYWSLYTCILFQLIPWSYDFRENLCGDKQQYQVVLAGVLWQDKQDQDTAKNAIKKKIIKVESQELTLDLLVQRF